MLKNQIRKKEKSLQMMKTAVWEQKQQNGETTEGTSLLHQSNPTIMNYQRNF